MDALITGALRTRLLVFLLAIFLGAAGYFAYKNLTIEAFPDPTDTQVQIIALYPGQPSEEVERRVSIPIEPSAPSSLRRLRDSAEFEASSFRTLSSSSRRSE